MFRTLFLSLLAAVPSSANYTLKAYDFGNGAGSGSSSNYALKGMAGSGSGLLTSSNYGLPAGIKAAVTAPVPPAPVFTNTNNNYDRLHLVLSVGGFASDTKYLIAISSDNFVTTKYVQLDDTIGTSLSIADYQVYAAWGGAGGFDVLGLASSTTYKVKVAALQGEASGSPFGPVASATTQAPSVTFGLQTSLTTTPPFSVAFASLPAGQVSAGGATITASVTSNAANGGSLLLADQNSGLTSAQKSFTLASATANLSVAASGYGAQVTSTSQGSGGPIIPASPYNSGGNTVGMLGSTWQSFANWSGPITSGSATLALAAKSSTLTPASSDYADIMTISLSLLF